jgi:hypothetical protein
MLFMLTKEYQYAISILLYTQKGVIMLDLKAMVAQANVIQANQAAEKENEKAYRASLTSPEERYYYDRAKKDEEMRENWEEQQRCDMEEREMSRRYEENKLNKLIEQNESIASELKKSNRSLLDKFTDLPLHEQLLYGYVGKKVYDKLGK